MDPAQWHFMQQQRQRDEAFAFLAWRDEQDRLAAHARLNAQGHQREHEQRLRVQRDLPKRRAMLLAGLDPVAMP